ncbi:MAG TPA: VOC family protein [Anaerolineales bacterium]|jgi:catechol 2,3-dioxygenase|nr:VOC family protein [Anaerolineales bacterium]HQX14860.1 VOC family protein [Anaerolineales bacterium]
MTQPKTETKSEFSIHPKTMMGNISLTVANLDNQIAFYQQAMGFKLHWKENGKAGLGAGGADLLQLVEQADVKKYRGVTGLYHVAYLFPNRRELAIAVGRLFALKYPNSPTDHILTKTTYLDDLEHNGIELYCESPEDGTWTFKDGKFETYRKDGSWSDGREALDVDALFENLNEGDKLDAPIPPGARIGHVHLHVRDVDEAVDFYHGVIGFDITGVAKPFQMGFVSAGGYHHHLGLNTWQGRGAPPPPPDAVGLRYFTIELPTQDAYDEVVARVDAAGIPSNMTETGLLLYDPSQNGVVLTVKK